MDFAMLCIDISKRPDKENDDVERTHYGINLDRLQFASKVWHIPYDARTELASDRAPIKDVQAAMELVFRVTTAANNDPQLTAPIFKNESSTKTRPPHQGGGGWKRVG